MIRQTAAVLIAGTLLVRAEDARPDLLLAEGIRHFQEAFRSWQPAGFAAAAGSFGKAAKLNPTSPAGHYWNGVARFHRMLCFQSLPASAANSAAAAGDMEAAMFALRSAIAADANHAESHALLGTLLGMKIQGGTLRALRYGPSVNEHRKLALQHGSHNPRVRYLSGAGLYHTARQPADFEKALAELRVAEKLFAEESTRNPQPLAPRWGASSCQTFIGLALEKLGKRNQAAAAFRKALAMHPADHVAAAALKRVEPAR